MGNILNGLNADTFKNIQLDAGVFVKNFDPETGTLATANILGATSGGGTFEAIPDIRNIAENLDGARGKYKGLEVIDSWDAKFTTTLKEMTASNLKLALGSATITPAGASKKYDTITAKQDIDLSDYENNISWLGTLKGQNDPIVIELNNVLNTNGMSLTFEDKGDGSLEVELVAHYDLAKPNDVPFKIYVPKKVIA